VIADDLPQIGKRPTEVGASGSLGPIWPQERSQVFAAMGAIGLDRKIGKQSPNPIRLEFGNWLVAFQDLKGTK
jgi:hypothetical protein